MKIYLPFRGEFGWYLMLWTKKFHGDPSPNKIVCCKKGHECLFPSATGFFYDWQDITDNMKAGIHPDFSHEVALKERLSNVFGECEFVSPSNSGWHDKHDYANNIFIPKCTFPLGLQTDIVITPRCRSIDPNRNWTQKKWQYVVDALMNQDISVGVCGSKESSFDLKNIKIKSYHHRDVDSDVELMTNAKLVVTQESGMQYLSFLCQKSTFCIDHYHKDHGADLHRPKNVPFKEVNYVWNDPELLVKEIQFFLDVLKWHE